MAEPMSSNEIEDVLSSIRRLVAQDLKPADRAKLAAVAAAPQKLVLAPESRVEELTAPETEQGAKFATVRRPSRRAAFPPVDAVLSAVTGDSTSGGDDGHNGDAPSHWSLGEGALRRKSPDLTPSQENAMQAALGEHTGAFEAGGPAMRPDPSLSYAEVAGSDDFVALSPGYGIDDAPLEDDMFINPAARLADVDAASLAAAQPQAQSAWAESEPEEAAEAEFTQASSAPDFAGLQGTIEPDSDWADAAEASVIAELAGEAVADEMVAQATATFREPNFKSALPSQPEVLFDEDQLRAMVQAIFREEMAGPMGERITRNIRKLVRAEVGRMLAAHELE